MVPALDPITSENSDTYYAYGKGVQFDKGPYIVTIVGKKGIYPVHKPCSWLKMKMKMNWNCPMLVLHKPKGRLADSSYWLQRRPEPGRKDDYNIHSCMLNQRCVLDKHCTAYYT